MSDEKKYTQVELDAAVEAAKPEGKVFTQDQVNAIVAEERRKVESKQDDLAKQLEDANGKVTTLTAEKDEAAGKVTELTGASTRYRVALKHGLPIELATRLQGDDEAAVEADAVTLKELVKPVPGSSEELGPGGQLGGGNNDAPKPGEDWNSQIRQAAGRTPAA